MIALKYGQYAVRIDSLHLRERLLLLVGSSLVIFLIFNYVGLQPLFNKHQLLLQDINDQSVQIEVLQARASLVSGADNGATPDLTLPLVALQQELGSYASKIQYRLEDMLEPSEAINILEKVIKRDNGLSLNTLTTNFTALTDIDSESIDIAGIADVNRYELFLQLEGGYMDTLRYLRSLESLPWKFFWSDISFEITDYPKGTVNLAIYTLGQSQK